MFELLVQISKYMNVVLMTVFVVSAIITVLNKNLSRRSFGDCCFWQRMVIAVYNLTNVGLIVYHEWGGELWIPCLRTFGILWAAFLVLSFTMGVFHRGSNRILTNCILFLISISMVILWRLRPYYAQRQLIWILISVVVVNLEMWILRMKWIYRIPYGFWGVLALGLAILPFLFPDKVNGSLNWVSIKGFSFQPSELIKPVMVFFLSVLFIRKHRVSSILIAGVVVGALSMVLLIQNDLGAILIFCSMFLLMVYDYAQNEWILFGSLALVIAAAFLAYRYVGHVRVRVDVWMDPWADVEYRGYQIAQSLFAISGGKFLGTGLYQGMPYMIPESWTDMIFAGICEEFGVLFGMMMVLIYLLMSLMMFNLVSRYETRIRRNLAMAISIITSIQTILIIGGVIKLIPLTGVTLPLVSYGGTSFLSIMLILGVVQEMFRSRTRQERRVRAYEEEQRRAETQQSIDIEETLRYADPSGQQSVPGRSVRRGEAGSRKEKKRSLKGSGNSSIAHPYDFEEPEPWE